VEHVCVRHRLPHLPEPARLPPRESPEDRDALAGKVAFLSRPESYPGACSRIDRIETHFSWVFLSETHVYKLKKPVHDDVVDLRTLESRRRNCVAELRTNRRFAPGVYEAVVPLVVDGAGLYRLGADGPIADWLLRMRRLPARSALDRVIAGGALHPDALAPVVALLCRVYARYPVEVATAAHRARLASIVEENRRELCRPSFALPGPSIESLCRRHRSLIASDALEARVREHRIVEGHGDLRPEHVFLTQPPVVIDALEFSRELRIVDTADELGYLALECERLGVPQAHDAIFGEYGRLTGDRPPRRLVHFYQSLRACVRARLAIRHLLDPAVRDPARWRDVCRSYLDLARGHVEAASRGQ
jgi:aminoglycoside phosphotransferase family enzyme